jgi:hypothetical protein
MATFTEEDEEAIRQAVAAMERITHRKYLVKFAQGLLQEDEFKTWQAMDPMKVSTVVVAIAALFKDDK